MYHQNHLKSQKSLKQLVVVPNAADGFPEYLDGYVQPDSYKNLPATFVPSKVPTIRAPPYLSILTQEHHITPHMRKVNLMLKFNTVPDQDLREIEKFLEMGI